MKTFMHKIVIVVSFVAMSLHCWAIDGFIVQTTDYSFSEKWSCTPNFYRCYFCQSSFGTVFDKQCDCV